MKLDIVDGSALPVVTRAVVSGCEPCPVRWLDRAGASWCGHPATGGGGRINAAGRPLPAGRTGWCPLDRSPLTLVAETPDTVAEASVAAVDTDDPIGAVREIARIAGSRYL